MDSISIVTGGGTGIGRALCLALAERGLAVMAVGRRSEPLEETRAAAGGRVEVCSADVAAPDGREAVVAAVGDRNVAHLVHNAGVLEPVGPLAEVSLAEWRGHQAVNVEAPVFLTQALIPRLSGGRVLHVSSGAAHHGYRGWGAYCASKAALHLVYQVYREELRERDIAVGSVRPGVVDTPMQALIRATPEERFPHRERFVELKESGSLVPPERAAAFMARLLLEVDAERFVADEWDIRDAFAD